MSFMPTKVWISLKNKVEISQNFVAFSEYMNFNIQKETETEKKYYDLMRFGDSGTIGNHISSK